MNIEYRDLKLDQECVGGYSVSQNNESEGVITTPHAPRRKPASPDTTKAPKTPPTETPRSQISLVTHTGSGTSGFCELALQALRYLPNRHPEDEARHRRMQWRMGATAGHIQGEPSHADSGNYTFCDRNPLGCIIIIKFDSLIPGDFNHLFYNRKYKYILK
jgi:hypothetical protein